jgi:hypothetical protein
MFRLRSWIMCSPVSSTSAQRASSSRSLSVTPGKQSRLSEAKPPLRAITLRLSATSAKA